MASQGEPGRRADDVERAAGALSPVEREVLVLSAREGLRNGAIAAKLGMSERKIERILARALRKLDLGLDRGGTRGCGVDAISIPILPDRAGSRK